MIVKEIRLLEGPLTPVHMHIIQVDPFSGLVMGVQGYVHVVRSSGCIIIPRNLET